MRCCHRNCIALWLLIGRKPPCPGGRAGSSLDQQWLTCYVVGFVALSSTQVAHPPSPDACQPCPKLGCYMGAPCQIGLIPSFCQWQEQGQ